MSTLPSSPLLLVAFILGFGWIARRSAKPLQTALWMIASLVAILGVFGVAAAIWPSRAGGFGAGAAIFGLLVSAIVGVEHMRSHRRPSLPPKF